MTSSVRIATVNVNGIRAALTRGFDRWLETRGVDVVALQEVRCPVHLLPPLEGWHVVHDAGTRAGRNGVALLSRLPALSARTDLGLAGASEPFHTEFGAEGRYVEADYDLAGLRLTIASVYVTKGGLPVRDEARYQRKLRFLEGFAHLLDAARTRAAAAGREYLCLGDYNLAASANDQYHGEVTRPLEGFLPAERSWLTTLVGEEAPLVDVVRTLHPGAQGPYTWWSWRTGQFDADRGWRIDLHLATPGLAARAITGGTDRPLGPTQRMSDHAPVVVDYQGEPSHRGRMGATAGLSEREA